MGLEWDLVVEWELEVAGVAKLVVPVPECHLVDGEEELVVVVVEEGAVGVREWVPVLGEEEGERMVVVVVVVVGA